MVGGAVQVEDAPEIRVRRSSTPRADKRLPIGIVSESTGPNKSGGRGGITGAMLLASYRACSCLQSR